MARTAVVYRRGGMAIVIAPLSLHPPPSLPCDPQEPLLHCAPGSSRSEGWRIAQYRLHQTFPLIIAVDRNQTI
jgi:hypothetical protein